MQADSNTASEILSLIPQKPPFRFVDEIISLHEKHILSAYTFREDEYFYQGHFPGNPVTPGVVLIETMAQSGVVAQGLFLLLENGMAKEKISQITTLFTLADQVEFFQVVRPGQRVLVKGEVVFFRKGTLRSNVVVYHENDTLICRGTITGSGINDNEN